MMVARPLPLLCVVGMLSVSIAHAEKPRSGYAPVHGMRMYYEIRGQGDPLIVLHGGFGNTTTFVPNLDALAKHRKVIAVDLQAHGRTADIDRPMTWDAMADDVAALLDHLKLAKADVMGYSLGGGVALRTAIRHADRVRKLVLLSTTMRNTGWYPELVEQMKHVKDSLEVMKKGPLYATYTKVAPRPEDFPILVKKVGELIAQDYDWSKETAALAMPVMIVVADGDGVQLAHAVEMFGLFGGGKRDAGWDAAKRPRADLAILPHSTHYDAWSNPLLVPAVDRFLSATGTEPAPTPVTQR